VPKLEWFMNVKDQILDPLELCYWLVIGNINGIHTYTISRPYVHN